VPTIDLSKCHVNIIIPTYNHFEDCLKPCIESIERNTSLDMQKNLDIWVVANGCTDGTIEYIQDLQDREVPTAEDISVYRDGPHYHCLVFDNAIGYPKAINAGMRVARENAIDEQVKSDLYILLNNDTAIQDGWSIDYWLNTMLEMFKKYPKCGVTGLLPNFDPRVREEFLIFCCVMISSECWTAVGELDESLSPGGGEDIDFCIRAKKLGFECREIELFGTPKGWYNGFQYINSYPLYHAASRTVHEIPNWSAIFSANIEKLRVRYEVEKRLLSKKKISIIIPTLNHLDDCLKPCCESIIKNTVLTDDIEIIVVANGCSDETKKYVQSLSKHFVLMWFNEPMGYPRAINAALLKAKGDYIVLLNNDTQILSWAGVNTWLSMLLQPFDDPMCGLSGPALQHNHEINEDFLIFFCVMISRKVIDDIGLLDEAFSPGAGEDTDFCIKAVRKGYKLVQIPCNEATSEDGKQIVGKFPLWHQAEATVHDLLEWKDVFKRNGQILIQRYGKQAPVKSEAKSKELNLANWDGYNTERAVVSRTGGIPAREKARYEWAKEHIFGTRILEIGCTSGYGLRFFGDITGLDYTGVDYNKDIIEYAKENFGDISGTTFIQADINQFRLDQYDTIIAFEVLEHLDNGRELAQRLKRHCQRLLISVPYQETPGVWGPHHKLHNLEERDFPEFSYYYITPDGQLQRDRVNHQGHGQMLMEWCAFDTKSWEPRVAIITPMYNDAAHIQNAIRSVDSQTYANYKHFIYDDASTDVYDIETSERRVCIRESINKGQSYARNVLLQMIQDGGFDCVAFLDSDDTWEPNHLSDSLWSMEYNLCDIAYSKPRWIDDAGHTVTFFGFGRPRKFIGKQLEFNNFIWISSVIAKIECFNDNLFDSPLDGLEDWDMWYRLYKQGYKFCDVGKQTTQYLVRDNGQAAKTGHKRELVVSKHGLKLQGTRLNVACGADYQADYINIDLYPPTGCKVDAISDVKKLPYDDDTVDEIRALHIIEHFDFHETNVVLKEWFRALKPGGKLILETPDLLAMCKAFADGAPDLRIFLYGSFFAFPWLPGQTHKFMFSEDQLRVQLGWAGFKNIKRIPPMSGYVSYSNPDTSSWFLAIEAYK
jgi:GT2 family glycosyltransferase/2-polyprenyl-3-methyl-5-hydroxy-6-metoxy-1,4-benzoquinol methylase